MLPGKEQSARLVERYLDGDEGAHVGDRFRSRSRSPGYAGKHEQPHGNPDYAAEQPVGDMS